MKKLILSAVVLLSFEAAHAHTFKWEGDKDSNAGIVYQGMKDAAATDKTVIFKDGRYGTIVSSESDDSALVCKTYDEKANDFICNVYIKHGEDLGPLESYPEGSNADSTGDASSNSALLFNILKTRGGSDDIVEVTTISGSTQAERATDESTLRCQQASSGSTQCRYER